MPAMKDVTDIETMRRNAPVQDSDPRVTPASIKTLPIWKKDSSPAEWLSEVAALAMEHPGRFSRIVVIYEEFNDKGLSSHTRWQQRGYDNNTDILGTIACAQMELFEYMKGRRS